MQCVSCCTLFYFLLTELAVKKTNPHSHSQSSILLFFFFSSSRLTKFKAEIKREREAEFEFGGRRNWEQVVANGGTSTLAALLLLMWQHHNEHTADTWFVMNGHRYALKTFLTAVFICAYASACGDTWASELGILSRSRPRFVLMPWKRVEYGTNGGVSILGMMASLAAGLCVGVIVLTLIEFNIWHYGVPRQWIEAPQWPIILLCIVAACGGSMLDSVLGSTLEYSGLCPEQGRVVYRERNTRAIWISGLDVLSGNQVNFISALIMGLMSGIISLYLF